MINLSLSDAVVVSCGSGGMLESFLKPKAEVCLWRYGCYAANKRDSKRVDPCRDLIAIVGELTTS